MRASREGARGGLSPVQAFAAGLASRVGTGAIFWLWCAALLGMAMAFADATLAQLCKLPQPEGTFRGGPA